MTDDQGAPGGADDCLVRHRCIGRRVLNANRALEATAIARLRERDHPGVSMGHTTLLIHLDPEGTRLTTLADRAGISKQAMGAIAKELAQVGYVTYEPDPTDRRATRISLTPAGERFLADALAVKVEIETELEALLGRERLEGLREALGELAAHFDRRATAGRSL